MKKILLLPLLLLLGCVEPPPPQTAEVDHVVNKYPPTAFCLAKNNTLTQSDIECTFANPDEQVASLCVQVSLYRHFQKEFVMSLHTMCSGGIAPKDKVVKTFPIRSTEHRKMSFGCGRKLETCYLATVPVANEP